MKQFIANRNEVIQGPSPRVLEVLKNFKPEHANLYLEDYYHSILIPKISEIFGIPEEQIITSYGEEDFFRTIFDEIDPKKDSVLTHSFHYAYYKKYLDCKSVALNTFEMREENESFVFDIENCIQQYQKTKPKILLLTSPNNPTGNSISAEELEKLLKNITAKILVVVDEAYWGFDERYDQKTFLSLLDRYPNLVFLRSFSKLYALAGLRIGFALCGSNVKNILKYQNRYLGLSRILEEVAIAALESDDYYKKLSMEVVGDRKSFINELRNFKNFQPFSSKANFVLVRIANNDIAERLRNALQKEEVVVCKFVDDNFLRVSVGEKKLTGKFLKLLERIDRMF
ncbi:MAG: aminotransferase class I/II-fold pyridoxal phosphate-dependent enzyme [Candidatus Kerfeldbacteria bacterium]|nr:aminotransferase class I/II-fold pyridoxal phosphate-dependent enzyme [Candidatus Kerfeldbacteria bacterium]